MVTTTKNITPRHTDGASDPDIIGIHTMEAPETSQTAENVARYFHTVDASAHWCVDNNSRVRSVEDRDTAWTLPPINHRSKNIEFAGYARQTAADWKDDYSIAMLEIGALCAAEWVIKYKIPIRRLTAAQIANGSKGFAGHVDVNKVYKRSSHWDPGPYFPWTYFLQRVKAQVVALKGKVPPSKPAPGLGYNNLGMSHAWIKQQQTKLQKLGYYKGALDGARGPQTIEATKRFQQDHGLEVDGAPGPKTSAKLDEVLKGKSKPTAPSKPSRDNVTAIQRAVRAATDNNWGPDTEKRLRALEESSARGGHDFPYGVKFAQGVVGTNQDGDWGPKSIKAHDSTVANLQVALRDLGYYKGQIDGQFGPQTDAALEAARKKNRL